MSEIIRGMDIAEQEVAASRGQTPVPVMRVVLAHLEERIKLPEAERRAADDESMKEIRSGILAGDYSGEPVSRAEIAKTVNNLMKTSMEQFRNEMNNVSPERLAAREAYSQKIGAFWASITTDKFSPV